MSILTDTPPTTVAVSGKTYPINTDYRVGIKFEQLMMDDEITPEEKLLKAKQMYFGNCIPPPSSDVETTDRLIWFYRCGKDEKAKSDKSHERVYDFEYDDKWIFAAFKEQYNIDLTNANMHWWTFRALFDALSEDTEFVKIMGYRAMKIGSKMSTSQKRFYQKMKRLHKLPVSKAEEKRINEVEQALINRQSLKKVL